MCWICLKGTSLSFPISAMTRQGSGFTVSGPGLLLNWWWCVLGGSFPSHLPHSAADSFRLLRSLWGSRPTQRSSSCSRRGGAEEGRVLQSGSVLTQELRSRRSSPPREFLPWFPELLNWLGRSCRCRCRGGAGPACRVLPILSLAQPCPQQRSFTGEGVGKAQGGRWLFLLLIAFTFCSIFSAGGGMFPQ